MNRRSTLLLLSGSLGACAQPVKYNTPSGRPERVYSASPERVRAALVSELVGRGYSISRESQSVVVGEKKTDNLAANLAYGTGMSPQATVRTTFTIIPQGGDTRVVADLAVVSNAGTGFERAHNFSNTSESMAVQAALNNLKP